MPSAPYDTSTVSTTGTGAGGPYNHGQSARGLRTSNNNNTFNSNTNSTKTISEDEALARAMQQEEQDAQMARNLEEEMRREEEFQRRQRDQQRLQERLHVQPAPVPASVVQAPHVQATPASIPTAFVVPPCSSPSPLVIPPEDEEEDDDAFYARQIEQQMRDEELARQLAMAEEEQAAQSIARAAQRQQQQQQEAVTAYSSTRRRCCGLVVPLALVAAGVLVWYFLVQSNTTHSPNNSNGGFFSGNDIDIPWLFDNDPFQGLAPSEVAKWNNGRQMNGLELVVVNALEEHWQDVFPLVVQDWDNGTPDTLMLLVEEGTPDPDCTEVMGISKVCNGNYGDTQWKGINQVILQNGFITGSTSKMNEYYLKGADESQRRYTLCHEVGHSFGLPHTDENFYNKDLGNCMDYTNNPEANMRPDESNFVFLYDLYGALEGSAPFVRETEAPTTATVTAQASTNPSDEVNNGTRRRQRRSLLRQSPSTTATAPTMPDHIRQKMKLLTQEYSSHSSDEKAERQGWRRLSTSKGGQSHDIQLGEGWSLQINKLLV